LRLDQDHRGPAQDPASRQGESRMDVHLRSGRLQSGSDAEPSASRNLRLGKAPGHLSRPRNHSQNDQQGKGIKPPTWFFSSLLVVKGRLGIEWQTPVRVTEGETLPKAGLK